MFSNLKAKKRITQLLIAIVVVALTATGSVLLVDSFIPEAKAVSVETEADLNSLFSSTTSGTLDITLSNDISLTGKLNPINSGVTVNLNMNGKTIQWYDTGSGSNDIMSTSYSFANTYWGMITNNGTLNISGSGTVASYHYRNSYSNSSKKDDYGVKNAAIVNTGTLAIGANVTVKCYTGMAHESGNAMQDMFVYSHGVYNVGGTTNTSGTIKAGSFAMGVMAGSTGNNSWVVAFSYGIYGGNVVVSGGNIYSEAKSGYTDDSYQIRGNKVFNYAIGIFANSPLIYGNANITTKATSWRDNDGDRNSWGNEGANMSWGIGVMYYGTNYPSIGADVSINASFQLAADSQTIYFPEYDTALNYWTRNSNSGPASYGRYAYAVAQCNNDITTAALYGGQSSETSPLDALGVSDYSTAPNTGYYRSELAVYNGLSDIIGSTDNKSASDDNTNETLTSYITMGAPGNNAGGQYMVYYRYRNASGVITSASATPNTAINSRMVFSPASGVFTSDSTALTKSSGGTVTNSNFYQLLGTYYVANADGKYGTGVDTSNISASAVTTKGTQFTDTFNMSAARSYYIWVDYQAINPTNVKVVATSTGNDISYLTTSTSFETTYTGKTIVPGTDFNLGVIDMKYDTDIASDSTADNTDVTSSYAISGSDTSKVQLTYSYSTDGGSTWKDGLPKDAGTYTIKVVVPSDTDISRSGAGNRNGGTFEITGTIKQATPTISGSTTASGTYGATIAELIDTSKYSIVGKNSETPTGTWTYSGYSSTDYPEAGSKSVALIWTPSGTSATNYTSAQTTVTVTVAKRDVTVAPADSSVTYGAKTPSYVLNYTNLAACDESKKSTWLANTKFEVSADGSIWQEYSSTLTPGTYQLRIATFGGDTTNNNFTTSGTATLTINRAPLYYTATATNKTYDGNNNVNVTLAYSSGAVNGDSYTATISTTGTVANSNAGENKAVTVNTADLNYTNSEKYYVSIQNSPTVTVSKATPEVSVADIDAGDYDSNRKLANLTIDGTATANNQAIAGTWTWKDASIVPTVDVTSYTAVFTPTDTTNYNTVEVAVTINVSKAVVTVSVDNKTVSYGDASPALPLVYTGFTGTDTIATVATTGTISAATTYSMGKNVGTYPITITMTDYEAVNYSFVAATDCKITVEKKNVTITAPSGSVVYGDADLEFTVNDLIIADDSLYGTDTLATINEQAQFGITTAYEIGDDVGSYAVTVSAQETTNYTFTFVNGTLTVTKAVLTVTANNMTIIYGSVKPALATEYTVTGYKIDADEESARLEGAPALSTQYVKGSNAGQYAISITVGTLSHPNYSFKLVGGTLTVNKLTIDTSGVTGIFATITHDEAYSEAVFDDTALKDVSGTFALKDSTAIADYTDPDAVEDPPYGKYITVTAIFTPTDSDNYNSVELNVDLYIEPKAITGAPVITGTAMEGGTISASVAGMAPSAADSYTYTWYVDGTKAGTDSSYTVKTDDIDKSIYVVVAAIEDKGYTGTAQSASVTAVEAFSKLVTEDQLDVEGEDATYTYDGSSHPATVAVNSAYAGFVSEDITVYYNGSTSAPYDAGTYIVTIDVGTPDVPANADRDDYYGPVSGLEIGTITIEKATVTATFTVADKTYDGTRKVNNYNVLVNGILEDDYVVIDISAMSIVFNKAAAGVQKIDITGVKLTGDDIANYTLKIEDTYATIEKATLDAVASGVTRAYNGSAQVDVTFVIDSNDYASIDSASTVYVDTATATATSANAGTWLLSDITYTLGGTSANNYVLNITNASSAQVTISKATPNVTAPVVTGLVYNANRTLGNIDLTEYYTPDSNGYWQFDDTTVVPTVKKTSYAATYVSKNSNYSNYSANITVIVSPKAVTLTAVDTTVSYGKAASYSVKADGFTGNDSLATMGGTQPTYVCTYSMGEDVGKYTIKINHNLDSNGNYEFSTVDGTLTVVPADLYVSATATSRDYNGTTGVEVKFAIVSGKYSNDDVALSTTTANGTASSANAGTRTVVYTAPTLTGSKASNYNLVLTPASGILTVTINKLDPEGVVFPKTATIEFSQALSWAEFSDDAAGDGTFALTGNVPNALGDYAYEVVFTPSDSVNYNTVTSYTTLTVTQCYLDYVAGVSGTAQVGEKLSVAITGMPTKAYDYIHYQWFRVSDTQTIPISGATSSTYTATEADVGYTIRVVTYFDATAPFVFLDGVTDQIGTYDGIIAETNGNVQEENLTFWQRLVKWIQSIIEALTGVMFIMG